MSLTARQRKSGAGTSLVRGTGVVVGALAVTLLLFGLSDLLTWDRPIRQDITEPVEVNLLELPPPETPQQREVKPPEKPKPRPRLAFEPDIPPPGFAGPDLGGMKIDVNPGLSTGGLIGGDLIFDSADLDVAPRAVVRTVEFPYRARQRNINGVVTVKLQVLADGSVGSVEILDAKPKGYFEDAVMKAAPRWRFEPGRIAGEAVPSWVVTSVKFDLDG